MTKNCSSGQNEPAIKPSLQKLVFSFCRWTYGSPTSLGFYDPTRTSEYPVSSASLAAAGWRLAIVPLSTVDQLIKTQVPAQLTRLAMPMLRGTASPIRTLSKSRYGTWMDGNPRMCVSGFPPYSTKTPRLFASTKHTVTTTTLTSHSYLAISGMATVVTTGIVLQIWNAGLWGYLVKVNGLTVSVCQ